MSTVCKQVHGHTVAPYAQETFDESQLCSCGVINVSVASHASLLFVCAAGALKRKLSFVLEAYATCTVVVQGAVTDADWQHTITFVLQGAYAQATCKGAYHLVDTAQGTFHVMQEHNAAHTTSQVVIKTVVQDTAFFAYQGAITIAKTAQHTDARQENKNLLLHNTARVTSVPTLEVQAHDVACAHGSAVSYVHDEHLFYAASRGIPQERAQSMIVAGFMQV